MRHALFAVAVVAMNLLAPTAQADPYRWCAMYGGFRGASAQNCYFVTLHQCRAAVSGVGGYCKRNPFYDGRPVRTPEDYDDAPRRRRHRR